MLFTYYFGTAIRQPELRERALHTTFVLINCEFRARAAEAHCAYYLRLEVAILQPELWVCSSRATFVLKNCDSQAGAVDQAGGTRDNAPS